MKNSDYHIPVLRNAAVSFLNVAKGGLYIDVTAGGGGHTEAILKKHGKVLAIDIDAAAIAHLERRFNQEIKESSLKVVKGNFANIYQIAKENGFLFAAGILFDLGLSSYQLEDKNRGFSFYSKVLDMRADQDLKIDAKFIINNLDERGLYELFKKYGQERFARSIADAIVSTRKIKPITTPKQLIELIRTVKPMSKKKINSATQVFQALRIAVNSELINLQSGLQDAVEVLANKGRLVTIAYHSLEDGIIKDFFRRESRLTIITKKPIKPEAYEIYQNPRARSALLRVAEKCQGSQYH